MDPKLRTALHDKVSECHTQLDSILADIPDEWNVNVDVQREKLGKNIFQKSWLTKVAATFKNFASLAIENP